MSEHGIGNSYCHSPLHCIHTVNINRLLQSLLLCYFIHSPGQTDRKYRNTREECCVTSIQFSGIYSHYYRNSIDEMRTLIFLNTYIYVLFSLLVCHNQNTFSTIKYCKGAQNGKMVDCKTFTLFSIHSSIAGTVNSVICKIII